MIGRLATNQARSSDMTRNSTCFQAYSDIRIVAPNHWSAVFDGVTVFAYNDRSISGP
jgi:hypothetical protein